MRALYVAQTGLTEPLAQSQILPYLRGLVRRGWTFDVLGLEPEGTKPHDVEAVQRGLRKEGIEYHPGFRSPSHGRLSKAAQIATLATTGLRLALQRRARIVHARSDLAALVAVSVARLVPGARSIYDCRGFLADEYADFGHWSHASFNYRGLRLTEKQLYRHADAVVTLTDSARRWLVDEVAWVPRRTPAIVVPCCVDLTRFAADDAKRAAQRRSLGVADDQVLVAYAGTLGSWYCENEMAQLFAGVARRRAAHLLVVTRAGTERFRAALAAHDVPPAQVTFTRAAPDEVASLLAAADVGISFAKPAFSKRASSPVKMGEYLASGASLVINRGVGDADSLLADSSCIDAGDLSPAALECAAATIATLRFDAARRRAAAALARRGFDLEEIGVARYHALYRELAQ